MLSAKTVAVLVVVVAVLGCWLVGLTLLWDVAAAAVAAPLLLLLLMVTVALLVPEFVLLFEVPCMGWKGLGRLTWIHKSV